MTPGMRDWLPRHPGPIYTVALDERAPGLVPYPIVEVVAKIGVPYFNNTAAYAIGYAIASEVKKIELYGIDFSYPDDRHGAEAGRACCEFLCGMAVRSFGIEVQVSPSSTFWTLARLKRTNFTGTEICPYIITETRSRWTIMARQKSGL